MQYLATIAALAAVAVAAPGGYEYTTTTETPYYTTTPAYKTYAPSTPVYPVYSKSTPPAVYYATGAVYSYETPCPSSTPIYKVYETTSYCEESSIYKTYEITYPVYTVKTPVAPSSVYYSTVPEASATYVVGTTTPTKPAVTYSSAPIHTGAASHMVASFGGVAAVVAGAMLL